MRKKNFPCEVFGHDSNSLYSSPSRKPEMSEVGISPRLTLRPLYSYGLYITSIALYYTTIGICSNTL